MESFKEIIDSYINNYSNFQNGKVTFECDYGELIFYKKDKKREKEENSFIIYGIYIVFEHRNKGLCREILRYSIDQCAKEKVTPFKYVCVESVLSKELFNYLLRFTYKNNQFKNTKYGFIYTL